MRISVSNAWRSSVSSCLNSIFTRAQTDSWAGGLVVASTSTSSAHACMQTRVPMPTLIPAPDQSCHAEENTGQPCASLHRQSLNEAHRKSNTTNDMISRFSRRNL